MNTKLSIIIPAYNVEKYIARTLTSILVQNCSDIEIIVVNDGSTDQTEQVVYTVIESSSIRNIVLYSKSNGGVSSARNFGLDRASGDYVYFLDGDDYVADDFISSMLALIDQHDPQAIHWPYDLVDERGATLSRFPYKAGKASCRTGLETLNAILLEKSTRVWTGSIAYKREMLTEKMLRYTTGCVVGEDLEFILMAMSYAKSVLLTDRLKTYYLQRPTSVINTYSIRKFDAVLALGRVRDRFLRLNTPEYLLLAKHFDEFEILHYYAGTHRLCLQYLLSQGEKRAVHTLSSEIDHLYPGMRQAMSEKMKTRKRKIIPDKIDVFRVSPILYMYLSRLTERTRTPV